MHARCWNVRDARPAVTALQEVGVSALTGTPPQLHVLLVHVMSLADLVVVLHVIPHVSSLSHTSLVTCHMTLRKIAI